MRFDESSVCHKHINFMKNISVPRLFTYKSLLQRINEIDMGMLHNVRETLCIGLDGKYNDLQELLILMAKFYLTVNKQRKDKLIGLGNRRDPSKLQLVGMWHPLERMIRH